MKIAIVSAHFLPTAGYQEVYITNACVRLKHEVTVFTTSHIPSSHKAVLPNELVANLNQYSSGTYKINLLRFLPFSGHLVIGFGLTQAIKEFSPDVLFIVGVGKIFPYPLLKNEFKPICLFGDNQDFRSGNSLRANLVNFRQFLLKVFLKNILYRKAVECSKNIICYTPQTSEIVSKALFKNQKKLLHKKKIESTLGFDPDKYFFNQTEREKTRHLFGLNNGDLLIVTATRVNTNKEIEKIIDGINHLHMSGFPVYYFIIGFQGDAYERTVRKYIQKQQLPCNYQCFPFTDHETLRSYYCASDIGIWRKAAISIQESMGTGLQLFLEDKGNINHLIEHGKNGWLYNKNSFSFELVKIVQSFISLDEGERRKKRFANCIANRKYSYDSIIADILLKAGYEG